MHRGSRRRRSYRQRDTQDSRRTLLWTRRPGSSGGTLSEEAGDDGLLQVVLNAPGASWIAALQAQEQTKNEEEELGLGQKDVYVEVFLFRLLCFFNRPSPLLFKRGLDFPYSTRTQISVQRIRNTIQIRISKTYPNPGTVVPLPGHGSTASNGSTVCSTALLLLKVFGHQKLKR